MPPETKNPKKEGNQQESQECNFSRGRVVTDSLGWREPSPKPVQRNPRKKNLNYTKYLQSAQMTAIPELKVKGDVWLK